MLKVLVFAGLLALPAAAQEPPASVWPGDVFSAVEWGGDGTSDHAVLVRRGAEDIDLFIYVSDPLPEDRLHMKLAAYAPGFASASTEGDDLPELEVTSDTSLQVFQAYLNRPKGQETVKLGYRNGRLLSRA